MSCFNSKIHKQPPTCDPQITTPNKNVWKSSWCSAIAIHLHTKKPNNMAALLQQTKCTTYCYKIERCIQSEKNAWALKALFLSLLILVYRLRSQSNPAQIQNIMKINIWYGFKLVLNIISLIWLPVDAVTGDVIYPLEQHNTHGCLSGEEHSIYHHDRTRSLVLAKSS